MKFPQCSTMYAIQSGTAVRIICLCKHRKSFIDRETCIKVIHSFITFVPTFFYIHRNFHCFTCAQKASWVKMDFTLLLTLLVILVYRKFIGNKTKICQDQKRKREINWREEKHTTTEIAEGKRVNMFINVYSHRSHIYSPSYQLAANHSGEKLSKHKTNFHFHDSQASDPSTFFFGKWRLQAKELNKNFSMYSWLSLFYIFYSFLHNGKFFITLHHNIEATNIFSNVEEEFFHPQTCGCCCFRRT